MRNGVLVVACVFFPAVALAQTPAPPAPPPTWTGAFGAGLSLTSGNSDTVNFNVAFALARTPKARNVIDMKALYLRGEQHGSLAVNRLSVGLKDRYTLSGRAFLFGQVDYLRDTFKRIEYLVAPAVGVGLKVIETARTKFSMDVGAGGVTEKNPGVSARTDAALTASEKLTVHLTPTASITHAASGLWKATDLSDGLYNASIGLATKVSERLQLSIDLLDTFRSKRPTPATKRNDMAFVAAVTAKF